MSNQITITVGDELFSFENFDQWVNKAQRWFRSKRVHSDDTICVDAKGRIVTSGKEFIRARDESAFPVKVYRAVEY
jgi:hypothetical protein